MASLRCSLCALDWRILEANLTCHVCGTETWRTSRNEPMPDDDALELGGPEAIGQDQATEQATVPHHLKSHVLSGTDEDQVTWFRMWLDVVRPSDFGQSP